MINSTCGVSEEDCHSMWTDGLEFSGKPVGPEGGHARWREQPDQSPEGVCRLSAFRSHETFAAAGESMWEGTLGESVSHQQLLVLCSMGHV